MTCKECKQTTIASHYGYCLACFNLKMAETLNYLLKSEKACEQLLKDIEAAIAPEVLQAETILRDKAGAKYGQT